MDREYGYDVDDHGADHYEGDFEQHDRDMQSEQEEAQKVAFCLANCHKLGYKLMPQFEKKSGIGWDILGYDALYDLLQDVKEDTEIPF